MQILICACKPKGRCTKAFAFVVCLALSTTFLRMLTFLFQSYQQGKSFSNAKKIKCGIPCKLKFCSLAIFLLLNRLFMSSLVTNRSHFLAFCSTAPSSSFSNPSPWSPTAKETSPKNLPRRQGCPLPSKRSFQRGRIENDIYEVVGKHTAAKEAKFLEICFGRSVNVCRQVPALVNVRSDLPPSRTRSARWGWPLGNMWSLYSSQGRICPTSRTKGFPAKTGRKRCFASLR